MSVHSQYATPDRFQAWLDSVEERFEAGPVLVDRATGFFEAY